MGSSLQTAELNTMVREIVAAGENRKRQIDLVIGYLLTTGTLRIWGRHIANERNCRDDHVREDLVSVIAERLVTLLQKVGAADLVRVNDWAPFLYGVSKNAVLDYLNSGQMTVASGMAGASRRANTVKIARRDLVATLSREPTNDEIIAYANARAYSELKDPAKQGALLSAADFTDVHDTSTSLDLSLENGFDIADPHNTLERKVEASMAAHRVAALCASHHPGDQDLAAVVKTWLNLALTGERVTVLHISNITGLSRSAVSEAMAKLNEVLALMRAEA